MPAPPRWLVAVPDAIKQLETLERNLVTRKDVERLFGVGRARAAVLMRSFGAELTGNNLTLTRERLISELQGRHESQAFRDEEERRTHVELELRRARRRGVRVTVAAETLGVRLEGLPDEVTVEGGRIEVRFQNAKEAVVRLFALAQALTNDYDEFEKLVEAASKHAINIHR